MEYKIVAATNVDELVKKTNAEIAKGWEPLGGVGGLNLGAKSPVVMQAMIKRTSHAQGT